MSDLEWTVMPDRMVHQEKLQLLEGIEPQALLYTHYLWNGVTL